MSRSVSRCPLPVPFNIHTHLLQLGKAVAVAVAVAVGVAVRRCVAMAFDHRRSWKITVHAKISILYIKMKATVKRPSGKFQRFLKLDKLLIGVDSKSGSQILVQRRRTLKSRVLSFVKKHFGNRRSKTSVGFKMPDASWPPYLYLVAETKNRSWHLDRLELSCVVAFGVGFGYLLLELDRALRRDLGLAINPSSSSLIMVCLFLFFVSWLHKSKFLWATLIAAIPLLLLEIDRSLEHFDLRQFW